MTLLSKNRCFNIFVAISFSVYVFGFVLGFLNSNLILLESLSRYKYILFTNNVGFIEILSNNLYCLALVFVGALFLGAPTLVNLLYNGYALGVITSYSTKFLNSYELFFLIIPHGIFEIPAIIIAGAAGFKIPYEIIRYLAGKKEQPLTKEDIKEYLTLALISIILIVIAAWVEANITLKIAKAMLNSTKGI